MRKQQYKYMILLAGLLTLTACGSKATEEGVEPQIQNKELEDAAEDDKDDSASGKENAGTSEEKASDVEEQASSGNEESESLSVQDSDYKDIYAPVLDEVYSVVKDGYDYDAQYKYVSNGIMEQVMYGDGKDLLQSIGYVIKDISGDNIPELLVGQNVDYEYDDYGEQTNIYNVYTARNGEIVSVIDGWARSSHVWMGNGYFLYSGSNGASSSMFGQYHLSHDGTEAEWDDFYFSEEDPNEPKILYFHNTNGIYDSAASERLDISGEDFWTIMDGYKTEILTLTSIGSYESSGAAKSNSGSSNDSNGIASDTAGDKQPEFSYNGTTLVVDGREINMRDYVLVTDSIMDCKSVGD